MLVLLQNAKLRSIIFDTERNKELLASTFSQIVFDLIFPNILVIANAPKMTELKRHFWYICKRKSPGTSTRSSIALISVCNVLTLWTPGADIPVLRKLQNGAKPRYTGSAQISLHRQNPVYRICVNL